LFGVILSEFARLFTPEKRAGQSAKVEIFSHIDRLESSIERLSHGIDDLNGRMSKHELKAEIESKEVSKFFSKLMNDQEKLTQTVEDASRRIREELSQAIDAKSKSMQSELSGIEKVISSCEVREAQNRSEMNRELCELKRSMQNRCCPESNIRIARISPDYRFRDDRRLNGIISWLTRANSGKNLEDIGLVRVITDVPCYSSYFGKHILDVRSDTHYLSQTSHVPGKWVGYDFGELIRILPTHYSVRSNNNKKDGAHLKSWVIEVSNDPSPNSTWHLIDERQSRDELNYMYAVGLYSVSNRRSDEYRCIRLRSTGPTWGGDHWLFLSGFEIFGELRLCESATNKSVT
jgi:hypothetical protein